MARPAARKAEVERAGRKATAMFWDDDFVEEEWEDEEAAAEEAAWSDGRNLRATIMTDAAAAAEAGGAAALTITASTSEWRPVGGSWGATLVDGIAQHSIA